MTVPELIDRFRIEAFTDFIPAGKIRIGVRAALTPEIIEEIKAKKPEILKEIENRKIAKELEHKRRMDAIDAIEGLNTIRDAMHDLSKWHDEWNASFNDVGGMGVRAKPNYDFAAMRAAYPRADAYLKAEEYANKSNYELSAIGKKAKEEVIFGDWRRALEQMEQDIKEFAKRHAMD